MGKRGWLICGLIVCSLATALPGFSEQKCVNADGEATVNNNDVPSARLEAIARAKWAAIEQTVGVDVKAGSFVSNFVLVEDVIKTKVGGSVKSFKVVNQSNKGDTFSVTINACIEPSQAKEAINSELALNNVHKGAQGGQIFILDKSGQK